MAKLKLQEKTEFRGMLESRVSIDETKIDLFDTPDNVQHQISSAMKQPILKADYFLTEQKIEEIRTHNMKPNEVSQSIFTETLEKYINNVGLKLPYDSDPGFYKDHYDREVKQRHGIGEEEELIVSQRISGRKSSTTKTDGASVHSSTGEKARASGDMKRRALDVISGLTSQMTTHADAATRRLQDTSDVSRPLFVAQS